MSSFAERLLHWYDRHGRKDLPWQRARSPYRVWVSEIMLQQTQVATAIPYFERFMARFPDVLSLADAPQDDVLAHWSGLGYYARARNLHRAAGIVRDEHGGRVPEDIEALQALPGIGRSTAGAILALACDRRHAILDGNVKRVLARFHAVEGWPGAPRIMRELWTLAEAHTPDTRVAAYTQAIMDLGATLCRRGRPDCGVCPVAEDCLARVQERVTEFPAPRPKKAVPERETVMLMVTAPEASVLLERRPPQGLWGGLWCFPQFDDESQALQWCEDRFGALETTAVTPWEVRSHTFTHFRLHYRPLHVALENPARGVMEADRWVWYKHGPSPGGGVPTPVRRLLDSLQNVLEGAVDGPHGQLREAW